MATATLEAPDRSAAGDEHLPPEIADRLHRLENEVAEVRHTLAELADIVVGDIKERQEVAASVAAPVPEIQIPPSLAPLAQSAFGTVVAGRRPWLLVDLFRELGTTFRMYMDPRYRVRRSTQLMVPAVLALMVGTYFFFHMLFIEIPVLTPIIEHLVQIVMAILLYKVLMREVARYRHMLVQYGVGARTIRSVPASLLHGDPDEGPVIRQEHG